MDIVSPETAGIARKNEQIVLQRLASLGQVTVAEELGVSESTVCRYKDGDIRKFMSLLAALGLKAVPKENKCYKPEILQAMLTLAKAQMDQVTGIESLQFED